MMREFQKGTYSIESSVEVGDNVTFEVWENKKKVGCFTRKVKSSSTGLPRVQYKGKLRKLYERKVTVCYYAGGHPFVAKTFWVKK